MKATKIAIGAIMLCNVGFGQYNTPWTTNLSNALPANYIGIGTKSTSGATNTPLPNFNLHVHGTEDYIQYEGYEDIVTPKAAVNYGKTSRIGLTNSITNNGPNDGTVLMQSENNFHLWNRENGNLNLRVMNVSLVLSNSTSRIWTGISPSTTATYATFNIGGGSDNGLYIATSNTQKYGLGIKVAGNSADAIQVFGNSASVKTFSVQGSGLVKVYANGVTSTGHVLLIENSTRRLLQLTNDGILRSREIIVDLSNAWPDYVFKADYSLMPLAEVDQFIKKEGHLPNIPSAAVIEEQGLNVGEMNALLMEKIEELTLYMIQQDKIIKLQEERLNALELAGKNH